MMFLKLTTFIFSTLCASSSMALWNGSEATQGQFPAAVFLNDCTGSKVGPRHFATAAHCVFDGIKGNLKGKLKSNYTADSSIEIHFGLNQNLGPMLDAVTTVAKIKKTHVHPSYSEARDSKELQTESSDIAIIEIEDTDTSHIQTAKFDFTPLTRGTQVLMAGYGLIGPNPLDRPMADGSIIASGTEKTGLLPLKFAPNSVDSILHHEFSCDGPGTDEPGFGDQPPLLGSGDSGGAVYLASDKKNLTIVGINSKASSLALKSLLTRIDTDTENEVATWIHKIIP